MPILNRDLSLSDIQEAVWVELRKGAVQKKHPFRNLVLSTIDGEKAASRWVVFRKLTDADSFLIYTDCRSDKVSQIQKNPNCALLFYHNRQGMQLRVNGQAKIHHQNELTDKYWPGVKGSGAKDYTTELPPGTPISSKDEGNKWDEDQNDKNFMILEIIPEEIDVLQLNRDGHIRVQFTKEKNEWVESFLVP